MHACMHTNVHACMRTYIYTPSDFTPDGQIHKICLCVYFLMYKRIQRHSNTCMHTYLQTSQQRGETASTKNRKVKLMSKRKVKLMSKRKVKLMSKQQVRVEYYMNACVCVCVCVCVRMQHHMNVRVFVCKII